MKVAVAGVVALVLAIVLIVLLRRDRDEAAPSAPAGSASLPEPTARGSARGEPAKHVRKVSPEDRKQLAEQIAAARARAKPVTAAKAPSTAGGVPALPDDDTIPLEQVSADVKTALTEAIPILAECYDQAFGPDAGKRSAVAQMQMTSDPDVGTVIDSTEMHDEDGQKLDAKLDACLRTTIESLEVPPFSVGGKVLVQYSFRFD